MPEQHKTKVGTDTDGGRCVILASCSCGWFTTWEVADGSAQEAAAAHARHFDAQNGTSND